MKTQSVIDRLPPPRNVLQIKSSDVVHDNRVCLPGELIVVSRDHGDRLVAEGRASWTLRVEILVEGIVIDKRVFSPGDVAEVPEARALMLHEHSAGRILEVDKLSKPLPPVKPRWTPPVEAPRPIRDPVECQLLKPLFHGTRNLEPGDVITVPRELGEYFEVNGAVKIIRGNKPLPFASANGGARS